MYTRRKPISGCLQTDGGKGGGKVLDHKEQEESPGVIDGFILLLVLISSQGLHILKLTEL